MIRILLIVLANAPYGCTPVRSRKGARIRLSAPIPGARTGCPHPPPVPAPGVHIHPQCSHPGIHTHPQCPHPCIKIYENGVESVIFVTLVVITQSNTKRVKNLNY